MLTPIQRVALEGARQLLWDAYDRLDDMPDVAAPRADILDVIRTLRAMSREVPLREALDARTRAAGEVA